MNLKAVKYGSLKVGDVVLWRTKDGDGWAVADVVKEGCQNVTTDSVFYKLPRVEK